MPSDLRIGVRSLLRWPLTSLTIVLTLALATGSTTAVFSLVDGVLLRPLPFDDPERLVLVWRSNLSRDQPFAQVSYPDFLDWRQDAASFSRLATMENVTSGFTLTDGVQPVRVQGQHVSVDFFSVLGADASIGRALTADDHRPGAERVVVLSDGLWNRLYGADRSLIGGSVQIDGVPFTVVGVMRPGFAYPTTSELWTPLEPAQPDLVANRGVGWLVAVGRLAPGVTLAGARAEMNTIADRLGRRYAPAGSPAPRMAATITPFAEAYFGRTRPALFILLGAVGLVLVIATVNVCGLLLARGFARERELAVRLALGAGPVRATRQLILEGALLTAVGGMAGIAVARGFIAGALLVAPSNVPRLTEVSMSRSVLVFSCLAVAVTVLVNGAVPAATLIGRARRKSALAEEARGATVFRHPVQRFLLVAEMALALLLLVAAGLSLRSFDNLSGVSLGFDPENLLTMEVPLSARRYPEAAQRRAFFTELVDRVGGLPGVEGAASVLLRPLWGTVGLDWPFTIEGQSPEEASENPSVNFEGVSAHYFRTMRIGVLEGRVFTESDRTGAPGVVVVSRRLADRVWPGESSLGKRLMMPLPDSEYDGEWLTVIGVVEAARYRELEDTRLDLYMSVGQNPYTPNHLMVRTASDPATFVGPIRELVRTIDANQPVDDVATMTEIVSTSLGDARFRTQLLVGFGVIALLLASLGLYATMSYFVTLRTREIGVRVALGAQRHAILRLVVSNGLVLVASGCALGVVGSVAATRVLEGLLFGVTPTDPVTMTGVVALLLATGFVASLIPAIRATRVDPLVALRSH